MTDTTTRQERLQKLMEEIGARMVEHDRQHLMKIEALKLASIVDRYDAILKAVIRRNDRPVTLDGMDGALQMFVHMGSPEHLKAKRAQTLLHIRHMRRWFKLFKGIDYPKDAWRAELQKASDLGFRYKNYNSPNVVFIGNPPMARKAMKEA